MCAHKYSCDICPIQHLQAIFLVDVMLFYVTNFKETEGNAYFISI